MANLFRSTSAHELLKLAYANCEDLALLEQINAALAERKNPVAFHIQLEIGTLLQRAHDKQRRRALTMRREEESLLRRRMQQGFFEWPVTDAPASRFGFQGDVFFYEEGLLSYVGYSVGANGPPIKTRRLILDCVFHKELPRVQSAEHMLEWGEPRTAARLKKMADCLASFTRNAKRNTSHDLSSAIADWELDLEYLYSDYYVGKFQFAWPDPNSNLDATKT
jgi:hypothetical protein